MDREALHLFLDQASLAEKAHALAGQSGSYDRTPTARILRQELQRLGVWREGADDTLLEGYVFRRLSVSEVEGHFSDRF